MSSLLFTLSYLSHALYSTGEPGNTNALRAAAEEALIIQITAIKEEIHGANKEVIIEAKILGVERTTFGLKKSQSISIQFTDSVKPLPNSDRTQPLEKDGVYPAFLNRSSNQYQPAAGPASFRMTPEESTPKEGKSIATRLGEAVQTVDRFLKVLPGEEKADELRAAVVSLGQSGDHSLYIWIQARLRYECLSIAASKAERASTLTPEQIKQMDEPIQYFSHTSVLIDAPK